MDGGTGSDTLIVSDAGQAAGQTFVVTDAAVAFGGGTAVNYVAVEGLAVSGGTGADQIIVVSTAQGINTSLSGGANDTISVLQTTGPLAFTADGSCLIEIGTGSSSLDNIQGAIAITPTINSSLTLRLNDTATTTSRALEFSGTDSGQTYKRTNEGGTEWRTLVEVLGRPITNFEFWGGSSGTTVYTDKTAAGTNSTLVGHAGALDIFAIGWAADMNKVLGSLFVAGQAADNDFAYYYEYLNPDSQSYTVSDSFIVPGTMLVQRSGAATVGYQGLAEVIFYAPRVGGNIVNVQSLPAPTFLNLGVGNGGNVLNGGAGRDLLIAGALASALLGGDDEDLLIGGTTIYDLDEEGLNAIMAVWASGADYSTRVADLRNGLFGTGKITANGMTNTLHGERGRDFFFASMLDLNDGDDNEEFVWF